MQITVYVPLIWNGNVGGGGAYFFCLGEYDPHVPERVKLGGIGRTLSALPGELLTKRTQFQSGRTRPYAVAYPIRVGGDRQATAMARACNGWAFVWESETIGIKRGHVYHPRLKAHVRPGTLS